MESRLSQVADINGNLSTSSLSVRWKGPVAQLKNTDGCRAFRWLGRDLLSQSLATAAFILRFQTAGLTLANRLSENPNVTVVVLEAGKPHIDDLRIRELIFSLHLFLYGVTITLNESQWPAATDHATRV